MTYDQLLMLEAVVLEGGFGKAAKKLHISQPSISTAIKKLEEENEITIFDRSNYRPELTVEGKSFYEQSLRVLEEMNNLKKVSKLLADKIEPEIKIAINDTCPMNIVLSLLRDFLRLIPIRN